MVSKRDPKPPMGLRILTWNINGLEEKRIGPRMEKLCLEILVGGDLSAAIAGKPMPPVPDVLVFQEMTRRAYKGQMRAHLKAAGFELWPAEPPDREDYTLIAVRPPWRLVSSEWRDFDDSPLRRGCVISIIEHKTGHRVRVLSGHMESLRSGSDARVAQAREIDGWLHEEETPAVFAGDTNLRQREWAMVRDDFRAKDAYLVADSPEFARCTWWPPRGGPGYRFDRVWLTQGWRLRQLKAKLAHKSTDHAGVEVLIEHA